MAKPNDDPDLHELDGEETESDDYGDDEDEDGQDYGESGEDESEGEDDGEEQGGEGGLTALLLGGGQEANEGGDDDDDEGEYAAPEPAASGSTQAKKRGIDQVTSDRSPKDAETEKDVEGDACVQTESKRARV